MTARNLSLVFGALAPNIAEQLSDAKMYANRVHLANWQKDADAITRLAIRGLIPDSIASASRQKLLKKICAHVKAFK